jgi:cold shock protein
LYMKGTVKFFNELKGFGFIAGEDGKEYFAHQTALVGSTKIREGDKVTFDIVSGDKGPKADKVALDSHSAPAETSDSDE